MLFDTVGFSVRAAPAAFLETTWGCTGGKAARSTVCRGQDTPPRRRFPAQRRNQKTAAHSPANRCSQTKISFSLSQAALPVQLGLIVVRECIAQISLGTA